MLALSYSSGHVAITTLALIALLGMRAAGVGDQLVGAALIAAAATVGVVGISVVILGFHFVSDVVGGAALGVSVTLTALRAQAVGHPTPPRDREQR